MTEEFITLQVIAALKSAGWCIKHFDFPQAGTGVLLHSSERIGKTTGSIKPDIICVRGSTVLIFENKVSYDASDVEKLRLVRDGALYDDALSTIGLPKTAYEIQIGVAMEDTQSNRTRAAGLTDLDVIVFLKADSTVTTSQDPGGALSRDEPPEA